jgi:peptidoglycan-associated lipoprotein
MRLVPAAPFRSTVLTRMAMLAAAATLAACSSTPLPEAEQTTPSVIKPGTGSAGAGTQGTADQSATATRPSAASRVTTVTLPAHLDPNSAISRERSVYFGFDEFSVPQQYTPMLEGHGRYLAANSGVAIRVEGHADERGSPEYNLALGQKRAEAVVRVLRIYGVRDGQMEAVSWGEERPQANGHDEASWARNRRVDLLYPGR